MDSVLAQKSLPPEIRMWLSSISVTDKLRRISIELNIEADELVLIPHLLFRLAAKDLAADHFVETLQDWVDVEPNVLNIIVNEIKDGILLPISGQLRDWGVDINQIRPLIIEVRRPIVAPPPPPIPTPQPKVTYIPPPPSPQPEYVPPPIPAMGGRAEISVMGGAAIEPEKVRGAIHIIGDAHEHNEKENLESRMWNAEEKDVVAGSHSQTQISSNKTLEDKKIKLPISPWQTEDEHVEPFILHKETALTPVAKEQEWKPPIIPISKAPTPPTPINKVVPPHPSADEQPPIILKPQIKDYVESILEQQKVNLSSNAPTPPLSRNLNPTSGEARSSHQNSGEKGQERQELRIKNIEEKQKIKTNELPEQSASQHNKDQELLYVSDSLSKNLINKPSIPKNSPSQISQNKTWEGKPSPPLPTINTKTKDKLGPNINGNTVDLR